MGVLGSFALAVVICTCVFWVLAIVSLFIIGQTALAAIATVFFIIPLYMVVFDYLKTKKTEKTQ